MEAIPADPLLEFAIVLLAAKICGAVMRKLGQPDVLGELIAGMLLGPSVLSLIHPGKLFDMLAEMGAILLLFEVGLESDVRALLAVGRSSLYISVGGIVVSLVLGYAVSLLLNFEPMTAVFIGSALMATSVGISIRTLSDMGKLHLRGSRCTLGAAIIDDVLSLFTLTILVSTMLKGSLEVGTITRTFLSAVLFFGFFLGLGVKVFPKTIDILAKRFRVRGALLSIAVATAILTAYAAELTGLATILGALLGGFLFAETEHKEAVANDIKPLSHILTPMFFVLMGMHVDVRVFGEIALTTILFITVAALGKIVGCSLGALAGGLTAREALIVGLNMIPRGEVGLLFAQYGLSLGILNQQAYLILIVVSLGSTLITPPLIRMGYTLLGGKRESQTGERA